MILHTPPGLSRTLVRQFPLSTLFFQAKSSQPTPSNVASTRRMRQILGKSELPESFPGRRGQLSSPVNNPGLATYSTFCDKGHRRVSHQFPKDSGRVPSWARPRLQMPSHRGRGKKLPQFPPCCQGSLLSQAGLFGVWVVIPGGDRPFSVVPHHCLSGCARGLQG